MSDKKELKKEELENVSGGYLKPADDTNVKNKPADTAVWIGGSEDPDGSAKSKADQ